MTEKLKLGQVKTDRLIKTYRLLNQHLAETVRIPNAITELKAEKYIVALEKLELLVDNRLPKQQTARFCRETGYSAMTLEEAEAKAQ